MRRYPHSCLRTFCWGFREPCSLMFLIWFAAHRCCPCLWDRMRSRSQPPWVCIVSIGGYFRAWCLGVRTLFREDSAGRSSFDGNRFVQLVMRISLCLQQSQKAHLPPRTQEQWQSRGRWFSLSSCKLRFLLRWSIWPNFSDQGFSSHWVRAWGCLKWQFLFYIS